MCLGGGITGLIQEVEDLCKENNNVPRQLLYEDMSVVETGCTNRGDIYDAFGRPILVILYHTNAISKAAIYRKSIEVARMDNICYVRMPTSLVTTIMGGIKSQLYHATVVSYCNNIYVAFGDYFLFLRYRGL